VPHPPLPHSASARRTPHAALGTPHSALRTRHPRAARRTQHSALGAQLSALGSQHSASALGLSTRPQHSASALGLSTRPRPSQSRTFRPTEACRHTLFSSERPKTPQPSSRSLVRTHSSCAPMIQRTSAPRGASRPIAGRMDVGSTWIAGHGDLEPPTQASSRSPGLRRRFERSRA